MRPYHKKRLLKLAAFLDGLPPEQFDIGSYGYKADCATVACVAGWAGLIPEFQRAGLKTTIRMLDDSTITFKGAKKGFSSDVVADFLGLNSQEAGELFYLSGYKLLDVKPKDAAKKIRDIVARHTSPTQKKGA